MQPKCPLLVLVLLVLAAIGCQGTLPPPEPPPYQGAEVRVACPPGLGNLIREQAHVWEARQNAHVIVVECGERGHETLPDADLWLLRPAALARHVVAGQLAPLPNALLARGAPLDWSGFLPSYREQLLLWDGTPYATPLVGEALVCLYRTDLYEDAKFKKLYRTFLQERNKSGPFIDLRPPNGWEELALQAEFWKQHHPSGKPAPSLPPLPSDDESLDRLFYSVAASYARRAVRIDEPMGPNYRKDLFEFHYNLVTGEPRIATPGFAAALAMLQHLQAFRPREAQARPEEAFLTGQAVLCFSEPGTMLQAQKTPALRDRVGVVVVPGAERYFTPDGQEKSLKNAVNRVPYIGGAGWLLAVPKNAPHQAAAFDLLVELSGPARSMQLALSPVWGGAPTRTEQALRDRWGAFNLDLPRTLALKDVVARTAYQLGIKNPVMCLRTPDEAEARQALTTAVRQALLQKMDAPQKVLQGVSERWRALIAVRGSEKHAIEYRQSLGLLGK